MSIVVFRDFASVVFLEEFRSFVDGLVQIIGPKLIDVLIVLLQRG